MCSARLHWRSPARLSRWRTVAPLLAGIGAAPARAANAASLRTRSRCDHEMRNCAAVMTPIPGRSSSCGQAVDEEFEFGLVLGGFSFEHESAAGRSADRPHGGAVLD